MDGMFEKWFDKISQASAEDKRKVDAPEIQMFKQKRFFCHLLQKPSVLHSPLHQEVTQPLNQRRLIFFFFLQMHNKNLSMDNSACRDLSCMH